jgi:acetylornithine deacetylase/succinyl-diaminopimelate desuccinylase-like protein
MMCIPGIYDDVRPLLPHEQSAFHKISMQEIARKATGLYGEIPFSCSEQEFAERLWRQPNLSINAIQSGSRKLVSNVIQDGAWARVSIRIVPDMKPQAVLARLTEYLIQNCPPGFRLRVTPEAVGDWWMIDNPDAQVYQIAARALEKGYGRKTEFVGCGASIPFVQPLSDELGGIPAILVGVEDPYTNAHSENESLNLDDFRKTIMGQIHMLAGMADLKRV